jgi:hypothetical protein
MVSSPVTIGSGVVLPADWTDWDAVKLRIVLAHERSHVRQGDFYLHLLASLYAAAFWFSPLGWWLKRKLCDLGEAISDRAGLEEAASRTAYAQVLLEFAAMPRPTALGVAMARTGNLSRRIERLLNEARFRQAFAGSRRVLLAVLLVPVALIAATALIRVEAATSGQAATIAPAPPQAPNAASVPPDAAPAPASAAAAPPTAPPEPPAAAPAAAPAPQAEPAAEASETAHVYGEIHDAADDKADDKTAVILNAQADSGTVSTRVYRNRKHFIVSELEWARLLVLVLFRRRFLCTDHRSQRPHHVLRRLEQRNARHRRQGSQADQGGKFLWFSRDGKSYFIDDPSTDRAD